MRHFLTVPILAAAAIVTPSAAAQRAAAAQAVPDYSGQREELQFRLGAGIYVAKYLAIVVEDRLRSFAVWTDGVSTALPKTDFVVIQSADYAQRYTVRWEDLELAAGPFPKLDGIDPPRYLTPAHFPAGYLAKVGAGYTPPAGLPF